MRHVRRGFVVTALLALAVGAQPVTVLGDTASTVTNPKHFFWAAGQPSPQGIVASQQNDLVYHGGNAGAGAIGVETKPAVYVTYWGPEWHTGFTTTDANGAVFSSATLQHYVNTFFSTVGGSAWNGTQTQYCKNAPVGATSCDGVAGAQFVGNPKKELKGVWTDTTPVPSDILALGLAENLVDDPIAFEAQRSAAHFNTSNPQATFFILTPPSTIATGQPAYCGYHTQTTGIDGLGNPFRIQYSFIPYLDASWPGLGSGGCGMNWVNKTSDSFGRGVFDGYSIVNGHEYGEAETDPDNFFTVQDGWNDNQGGQENGDKCAWKNTANVSLNGVSFPMQPMWSNRAFDAGKPGCQMSL